MFLKSVRLTSLLLLLNASLTGWATADLVVSDNFGNQILSYDQVTGEFLNVLVSSDPNMNGGLSGPVGLVLDSSGNLLVASQNTNSILRFDADDGTFLNEFASAATGANFAGPADIRLGPDNLFYVANFFGSSVDAVAADGTGLGPFTSGGPGLSGVSSFAFGPDGNLYVASFNTGEIQVFDGGSGAFLNMFADSLPGASGLVFDNDGSLWVASLFTHQISEFDSKGQLQTSFSTGGDTFPSHILISPNNDSELLIALAGAAGIFRFSESGTPLGAFATGGGLIVPGQSLITGAANPLGDVNGDGVVNLQDVAPFVDAITNGIFIAAADINLDGVVNLQDVAPFVQLLTG